MNIYQKFGILSVSFLFLLWLLFQPLSSLGPHRSYLKMPCRWHEITQVELNDFLGVWSNMMQSSYKDSIKDSSLTTTPSYPKTFKSWLYVQHWSIERFFYTEQRIRDLLKYAEIKTRLADNKKIASKSATNLRNMNKDLEERLSTSPYSDKELDLIILNIFQITEVLDGRAILKAPR